MTSTGKEGSGAQHAQYVGPYRLEKTLVYQSIDNATLNIIKECVILNLKHTHFFLMNYTPLCSCTSMVLNKGCDCGRK